MTRQLTFLLGLAVVYLSLINLDRVGYWADEAINHNIGKTLMATGDIVGWDGRNLTGGTNGRSLNHELRDTFPPLSYLVTGLGTSLFGDTPAGARSLHALAGIAGIALFYLYLQLFLSDRRHRRLLLLTLAFIALSVDLSMFMRQARYFSLVLLTLAGLLYGYERYCRDRQLRFYLLMAVSGLLGFFNHYSSGAMAITALGCWHLLFRARAVGPRDYALFTIAGVGIAILGAIYLQWMGILSASGFRSFSGLQWAESVWFHDFVLRLRDYHRASIENDWLPYPLLIWYGGYHLLRHWGKLPALPAQREVALLLCLGFIYLITACVFSIQPVSVVISPIDHRYFFCVIPFFALLKASFVEWIWRHQRWAGGSVLAVMLLTNFTSYPINTINYFIKTSTLGPRLPQYLGSLHRDYNHPLDVVARILNEQGEQDDLVFVGPFFDREVLIAANGDRFIYCCHLQSQAPRVRDLVQRLPASSQLGTDPFEADWHMYEHAFGQLPDDVLFNYEIVAIGEDLMRFTQRPAAHTHTFRPIPYKDLSFVLLRKRKARDPGALP